MRRALDYNSVLGVWIAVFAGHLVTAPGIFGGLPFTQGAEQGNKSGQIKIQETIASEARKLKRDFTLTPIAESGANKTELLFS
jgi:hypothetical protein